MRGRVGGHRPARRPAAGEERDPTGSPGRREPPAPAPEPGDGGPSSDPGAGEEAPAQDEGERRTLFALWSAGSALKDAGFSSTPGTGEQWFDRDSCGVVMAAGRGINWLEDVQRWINEENKFDLVRFGRDLNNIHKESLMRNNSNRPAALIAKKFGLDGYNATITTACASASQAIGTAYRAVCRGDADMMVAGGADSMINPVGLVFFVLLGAASVSIENPSEVCRPFDRKI